MKHVCLVIAASCAVWCCSAGAVEFSGKVTAVNEGDLLTIAHDGTIGQIRLFGVDCPEAGQPFAEEARAASASSAHEQTVKVLEVTKDGDGRSVGWVILPDGSKLNNVLVAAGLAWWDQERAPDEGELSALNAKAIGEKAGLWADEAPLAPWDYRAGRGGKAAIYTVAKATEEKPKAETEPEKKEPEVKTVKAKGEDTAPLINYSDLADAKIKELGPALIMKHKPMPAKDADGNVIGWTASDISQIPFAKEFGFQDGDIVTSVNGVAITDMSQIPSLIQQFQGVKDFNVDVLRGGQPTNIHIAVP